MELCPLRYFVAVADELHFGRAAAKGHTSPPSPSQHLLSLGKEFAPSRSGAREKPSDFLAEFPQSIRTFASKSGNDPKIISCSPALTRLPKKPANRENFFDPDDPPASTEELRTASPLPHDSTRAVSL